MGSSKKTPIDPATGPTVVLQGRIVTMNDASTVIQDGRLYIDKGSIVAAQDAAAPAPAGFAGIRVTNTRGTIYPGLIELHNHLAYNALRLWQVPKKYTNRDQWSGIPEYRKRVSGPMTIIGKTPGLLAPLIRFVETKCLVSGVTTSQGIALFSNSGIRRYYRGIVRNVESTDEAALPEAETRIADVDAASAQKFLERLRKETCFLLHLSEGVDEKARKHFQALQTGPNKWAITKGLCGIHSAGLTEPDLRVYGENEGSMVWSPMSNLLLYGSTARMASAKANGVRIGIGSDWSPSGSKNLLGELKVAKLFSANNQALFSSREIVAMATRTAADILQWKTVLGSLETGKRADLLVIDSKAGDPYDCLIDAKETDIALVMVNGVPRFGTTALFTSLGVTAGTESVKVGSASRRAFYKQDTQDPQVGKISLSDAQDALKDALKRLPKLAKDLEKPRPVAAVGRRAAGPVWQLALDEIADEAGAALRARLPMSGKRVGARALAGAGSKPLSQIVEPLVLDALTVASDDSFLDSIAAQKNPPAWLTNDLKDLY
jgi:5-methylthioadenosine/S-adenosylhomocysteine deaminase